MTTQKKQSITSLKKAAGILNKVIKMVESNCYCIDVMQQNLAVIGLLKSAHQKLMERHLNACFKDGINSKNPSKQERLIKELLQVTKLCSK